MNDLVIGEPNPRQKLFFAARKRIICFGGARGGGKSWAVRVKAVLLCLKYPGIKVMIIRKTYPELQENHIIPLCEMLRCYHEDKKERIAAYNDSKKHMTFPNGSRIIFRYCEQEKDAMRFQGTEVDVLFVDEATQQSESSMTMLRACVRGVNSFPKRIYYTCNPGGPGHEWVKRLFIDKAYRDNENPEDYCFIQSRVTDNKALMKNDPDYIKQLKALPPKLREAWLHGRWDIFQGQFFEELRLQPDAFMCESAGISQEEALKQRRFTHVIPAFDLNEGEARGWRIMRSYDWGYNRPFSLAWWAVDYDGTLYRILEMYGWTGEPNEGIKWTSEKQFQEARRIEQEHPWLRGRVIENSVADPSIWDASHGESTAEIAARYGFNFMPGDNKRIPGWMQVHYRLQFDELGYPRMYVFDNCKAFIRTMPLMMYSDTKPEDLDTELEDHCPDEVRYMCMSRPVAPMRTEAPKPILSDPLDQLKKW